MALHSNTVATELPPFVGPLLYAAYLVIILVLVVYGLHRYWLVYLYARHARGSLTFARGECATDRELWPTVTVQIPVYNEPEVVSRAIDAVCSLDYPRNRMEVQVLDDSTDATCEIAARACERWGTRGLSVRHLRRADRVGFKAGALAEGLKEASGELIAVFDADFVPGPQVLKAAVSRFTDSRIGMVQTRWTHLNRAENPLTQSQAVFLDGHFVIEHTARHRADRWINFNGTAGVWRRCCIDDAGGWQHDTLTEDVDLSYRAQLRGWRFIYDPTIECPGELPPRISAFKTQQHRWTKGSIQTAVKLLPTVLRSDASRARKIEAWFHLTSPAISVLILALTLLLGPALNFRGLAESSVVLGVMTSGLTLFALATASAGAFYVLSQREQGRGLLASLWALPAVMALGIGMSANNARGVFEALLGARGEFIRTPKSGGGRQESAGVSQGRLTIWSSGVIELALGAVALASVIHAIPSRASLLSAPFLLLFACGYLGVGIDSLKDALRRPCT